MQALARIVIPCAILWGAADTGADQPTGVTYRVDSEASSLHVLVYRGGMLGRLGHNHVISATGLGGHVTLPEDPLRADIELVLPVAGLEVDDPMAREAEGSDFPGEVPDKDRSGTRSNMLGPKLLHLADDASLRIESTRVEGTYPDMTVTLRVDIRGKPRELSLPLTLEMDGNRLVATGEQRLRHADLGLRPFSAALGALRVQDEFMLRYKVVAERDASEGQATSGGKRALPVVDHDAVALRDGAPE